MGKLSSALAVEHLELHAEGLEQLGQDDASHAVDGVGADTEVATTDGLGVHQSEVEHRLNMSLVHRVVLHYPTQLLHGSIVEVFGLSDAEHLSTVGSGEELALAVQQLQGVPLCRVMASGNDDTAVGLVPAHG